MPKSSRINHDFTPNKQTLLSSPTHLVFHTEDTLRLRNTDYIPHVGICPSTDKANSQTKSPKAAFVNLCLGR